EAVIDADVPLVLVVDLVRCPRVIVGRAWRGRQRVPLEEREGDRIHALGGNDATRKRRPAGARRRGRIEDGRDASADWLGEDALALQQRGHHGNLRTADRLPLALIVREEERAVFDERAAQRPAELIAAIRRLGGNRGLK